MVAKAKLTAVKALKQKLLNKVEQFKQIRNGNWKCKFGWHHWILWREVDEELGFAFDFMKCDRPGCKWSGLTWVERERLHE